MSTCTIADVEKQAIYSRLYWSLIDEHGDNCGYDSEGEDFEEPDEEYYYCTFHGFKFDSWDECKAHIGTETAA